MSDVLGLTYLGINELRALVDEIDKKLIEMALASKVAGSEADLVVRDLKPSDIGLSNEVWSIDFSGGNANDWNRITPSNGQKADTKTVAFYGFANLSPNPVTTGLRFTQGYTRDVEVRAEFMSLERAYIKQEPEMIFQQVVYYNKDEYMNIYAYISATQVEKLILYGRVCEPIGKVISKR